MKFKVYSIFDRAAQMFAEPWVAVNDVVAIRKFFQSCEGMSQAVAPDLQLFALGEIDMNTGVISSSVEFIQGYALKEGN